MSGPVWSSGVQNIYRQGSATIRVLKDTKAASLKAKDPLYSLHFD